MADGNEICTFKKKTKLSQKTRKRKSTSDEGMLIIQCGTACDVIHVALVSVIIRVGHTDTKF